MPPHMARVRLTAVCRNRPACIAVRPTVSRQWWCRACKVQNRGT